MWYGSAYAQALAWAPPVPLATDGAVQAIAFAPQSDGQVGEYTCAPTSPSLAHVSPFLPRIPVSTTPE